MPAHRSVAEDETLKAACHGLLLGCALPVFAYNVSRRNWRNVALYGALIAVEGLKTIQHLASRSGPFPYNSFSSPQDEMPQGCNTHSTRVSSNSA